MDTAGIFEVYLSNEFILNCINRGLDADDAKSGFRGTGWLARSCAITSTGT